MPLHTFLCNFAECTGTDCKEKSVLFGIFYISVNAGDRLWTGRPGKHGSITYRD
jgi:hypothetical protein